MSTATPMTHFRNSAGLVAALALVVSLAGCASSGGNSPTSSAAASPGSTATGSVSAANEAFCTSSAALKTKIGNLQTLVKGGSVTPDALRAQKQDLASAGKQAKTDAQGLNKAIQVQVSAAQAAFQKAIDAIPADQTVTKEKVAAYVAAGAVYAKALDAIINEVGCP